MNKVIMMTKISFDERLKELEAKKKELKEKLDKYYNILNKPIVEVNALYGKNNKIIGYVTMDYNEDIGEGMVVLFPENNVPKAGSIVYLTNYDIRDSKKNPGKKYIKAFEWVYRGEYEDHRDKYKKEKKSAEKLYDKIKDEYLAVDDEIELIKSIIDVYNNTNIPKELLYIVWKLTNNNEEDIAMKILYEQLKHHGVKAVLNEYTRYYYLVYDDKIIYMYFDTSSISYNIDDLHCSGTPYNIVSDEYVMFTDDEIFECFYSYELTKKITEKLGLPTFFEEASSGWTSRTTILVPKDSELYKKLKVTKEHVPPEFRKDIYLEILGLTEEEVS